jgi:hypothetical protein
MFWTNVVEKVKTHILCSVTVVCMWGGGNCVVYDMWKSIVELGVPQMTMWHMCSACWIPKATNTHPEYIILILLHCDIGCTNASNVMLYAYCPSCCSNNLFKLVILDKSIFISINITSLPASHLCLEVI